MLKISRNVSLKPLHTFAIDEPCSVLVESNSVSELQQYIRTELNVEERFLVIGGGSDILFTEPFNGTIILPSIPGITVMDEDSNSGNVLVKVGAGVIWDSFVLWCCNNNLWGVENMSGIPGHVGASPVQNVGAYGMEAGETISKVEAIDIHNGNLVEIPAQECHFEYRNSRFKNEWKNKFVVTNVYFTLNRKASPVLAYAAIKQAIGNQDITLTSIRSAILSIRENKLPDVKVIPNAGSFFKNPVVANIFAENLKHSEPDMPTFPLDEHSCKLAAGWLIEQCGWKGKSIGQAGVYNKQALVLVNHGGATGSEIKALSTAIQKSVFEKFNIKLEPEVYIF